MTTALCPGSFDPPTNGHVDVIARCIELFDRVIVAVVSNPAKIPTFTASERKAFLEELFGADAEVTITEGLIVDHARDVGADVMVKGLRAVSDFEYELQMAQMNKHLSGIDTMFVTANPVYGHLSSSLVKEVVRYGGDPSGLVPSAVAQALRERLT